jgi:D-3-phosphoglycerate dehydrogenase
MTQVGITDHPFGTTQDVEREVLAQVPADLELAPASDEATLTELASRSQGLLVCYAPVTRAVVEAAAGAGCTIIARYGIGYDNVDIRAATEHGITVTNVPDYCLDEVADHTMALVLASARGVSAASSQVRQGNWVAGTVIHSLRGRTLALIGLGRIGLKTAERARPFGLRVVAYDPFVKKAPEGVKLTDTFEEAVRDAHVVSLHVPMSANNRNLIDADAIALMRNQPLLVNTSRGGLVDLDAAMAALDSGALSGLAVDVTDPEPLPAQHPLRTHPKAIVTPHIAFYSEEAQLELQRRAADEVRRALRGEPPRSPVNAEALAARTAS